MFKIALLLFTSALLFGAYNPFFNDQKAQKPQVVEKKVYSLDPPVAESRQTIKIGYFGFIESAKGRFALVSFDGQNIVIKESDTLHLENQIYKIIKITSSSILINDKYSRSQSIYFSSENEEKKSE